MCVSTGLSTYPSSCACSAAWSAAARHQQWHYSPLPLCTHLAVLPQRHLQHVHIVVAHEQRAVRVQERQRWAPRRQAVCDRIQLAAAELAGLEHVVQAVTQALVQPLALLVVGRREERRGKWVGGWRAAAGLCVVNVSQGTGRS